MLNKPLPILKEIKIWYKTWLVINNLTSFRLINLVPKFMALKKVQIKLKCFKLIITLIIITIRKLFIVPRTVLLLQHFQQKERVSEHQNLVVWKNVGQDKIFHFRRPKSTCYKFKQKWTCRLKMSWKLVHSYNKNTKILRGRFIQQAVLQHVGLVSTNQTLRQYPQDSFHSLQFGKKNNNSLKILNLINQESIV